ncbi:MAG: tRNA (guanosine(46)-N7)-methyltransferase TrmB [Tannerella sp.]|jgi:tRNA (guanine-N7-)-methyltransferase|nr:tRNA (guanosine(46)-N7)-methyltransferase TrmB [Tannerella sp.]
MAKNKLRKFAEMNLFPHVFQYPFGVLQAKGFAMKGQWQSQFFKNRNPVVLELGCGKGEYTLGLGKLFPEKNFIGVDIKGARIWSGARQALEDGMTNVAFLRTHIELINAFFAPGEVSEIWITFPDPQMKKTNKRLTSARFMKLYREILCDRGLIHLKTDSPFLYAYTCGMIDANHLPAPIRTDDLYHSRPDDGMLSIRTFYEQQWLDRGLKIKYIRFVCEHRDEYLEPDMDIEPDTYRSFNRRSGTVREIENQTYCSGRSPDLPK